jgi:hypothetical protein
MQDPRALANTRNLDSYRAWDRESLWRSGLNGIVLIVALSATMFPFAVSLIAHGTKGDAGAFVRLMGAALILYIVALGALMLIGVLRRRAWKRAHPWTPPSPARRLG